MFRTLLVCYVPAVLSIIVTDPPPSESDYKYAYTIEDPSTGDSKSQHEVRQGDVVTGAYSVVGPDGTKRIVEYTADSKHGFKAVLREEPATEQVNQPPPKEYFHEFYSDNQEPQYYTRTKPTHHQEPIAYNLVQKLPIPSKGNQNIFLFTPENEIQSDRLAFDHGKYFEPATK